MRPPSPFSLSEKKRPPAFSPQSPLKASPFKRPKLGAAGDGFAFPPAPALGGCDGGVAFALHASYDSLPPLGEAGGEAAPGRGLSPHSRPHESLAALLAESYGGGLGGERPGGGRLGGGGACGGGACGGLLQLRDACGAISGVEIGTLRVEIGASRPSSPFDVLGALLSV